MPEFHAREPEHQKWKAGVLGGEFELEEVDTESFNLRGSAKPSLRSDGSQTRNGDGTRLADPAS